MSTDEVRKSISNKGRKIVNVFPGPVPLSLIVSTVPKNVDVQFELFWQDQIIQRGNGQQVGELDVSKVKSRLIDQMLVDEVHRKW